MARDPAPHPTTVIWRITDRCDLDCRHCGVHGPVDAPEVAGLDELKRIADDIADAGCRAVILAGGEPLVRDDWRQLAEHLLERELAVALVTNGHRFDAELATWCFEVGVRSVHFSLDGGQVTHDAQRRSPGSFERVTLAMGKALDAGLFVAAITVITRAVLGDLEEVYRVLDEVGVDQWQVRLAAHQPGNVLTAEDYVAAKEVPKIVDRLLALHDKIGGPDIVAAPSLGYYGAIESKLRGASGKEWRGCSCGIDWCTVEPNGDVKACSNGGPVVGSLKEETLLELWQRPDVFAHTRHTTLAELGGGCRDCEWARLCGGGCLAISFEEGGLRQARHCLQHPDSGGPRERPGFVERRRVKKLRREL